MRGLAKVFTYLWSFLSRPTSDFQESDVLFVASPADISTPSPTGLISQYLHPFWLSAETMGLKNIIVIRPNTGLVREKTQYKVSLFPRFSIFKSLHALNLQSLGQPGFFGTGLKYFGKRILSIGPRWHEVLEQISPKIVIGIGLPEELCKAARKASIPTVEVQHGFFGEMPPYWKSLMPDYFACWGQYAAKRAANAGLKPLITGHPFHYLEPMSSVVRVDGLSKSCCVTLSWDEQGTVDSFGTLSASVQSMARMFTERGINLVVRFHPVIANLSKIRVRKYVREIEELLPGALIHDPLKVPLIESILSCDFALTESSSTAFDFAIFGKTSFVLDETAWLNLSNAIQSQGLPKNLIRSVRDLDPFSEILYSASENVRDLGKPADLPIAIAEIMERHAKNKALSQ